MSVRQKDAGGVNLKFRLKDAGGVGFEILSQSPANTFVFALAFFESQSPPAGTHRQNNIISAGRYNLPTKPNKPTSTGRYNPPTKQHNSRWQIQSTEPNKPTCRPTTRLVRITFYEKHNSIQMSCVFEH